MVFKNLNVIIQLEYPYITNSLILDAMKNKGLDENQKYLSKILKNILVILKLLDKKEASEKIIQF